MATFHDEITPKLATFINAQHIYFVATAAQEGRVNLSPKGLDTLRLLGPNRLIWLNLTGSGNETAAHVALDPRMTLMLCSFAGPPQILRLYGTARCVQPGDADFPDLVAHFPTLPGSRQVFDMTITQVQTSCGFAVPEYTFDHDRDLLVSYFERRGPDGTAAYQREKNTRSIDGFDTHLPAAVLAPNQ